MSFAEIIQSLKDDPRNASYTKRGVPPIFQASAEAKILIVGQAPGKKVEETGIPFNDKSGEKLIAWMGITRDEFYSPAIAIVPMDFYYPGKGKTGDLPPRLFIAREYHEQLLDLMPGIKLTMLIGAYAQKFYLGPTAQKNLTETVRHFSDYLPRYFPLVHPSPLNFRWQAKNPWFEVDVVPELQIYVSKALNS